MGYELLGYHSPAHSSTEIVLSHSGGTLYRMSILAYNALGSPRRIQRFYDPELKKLVLCASDNESNTDSSVILSRIGLRGISFSLGLGFPKKIYGKPIEFEGRKALEFDAPRTDKSKGR